MSDQRNFQTLPIAKDVSLGVLGSLYQAAPIAKHPSLNVHFYVQTVE
jgi:hypothetical protein